MFYIIRNCSYNIEKINTKLITSDGNLS